MLLRPIHVGLLIAGIQPAGGDDLSALLRSLTFVESGSVRPDQRFAPLRQCAEGILQSSTQWNDDAAHPGTTMEYMYDVTNGSAVAPPVGMRSAVPLGGLGTGSVELRGDGSFRDWMLENQGPALAANQNQNAKLPLMAEAVLGVRSGGFVTSLRTHDHAGAPSIPLAGQLTYSGAFPFSELALDEPSAPIRASLFSWAPMKLFDENVSATPLIAFSLMVSNPAPTSANVSLWVSLPVASVLDVTRQPSPGSSGTPSVGRIDVADAAACLKACDDHEDCTSWSLTATPPKQNCSAATIPTIPYCTLKSPVRGTWPLVAQPGTSTGLPNRSKAWLALQPRQSGAPHDLGPDVDWDRLIPTNYHCWSVANTTVEKHGIASCADSCERDEVCEAWSYVAYRHESTKQEMPQPTAASSQSCMLFGGAPAVQQYQPNSGAVSGVKGQWKTQGTRALVHTRANPYQPCGNSTAAVKANERCRVDASAAIGDFTVRAADYDVSVRRTTANSLEELWRKFADSDGGDQDTVAAAATHGALEVTALLAPKETRTISVVFSWYLPERDYAGDALGNYYSKLHRSSMEIAQAFSGERLLAAARDAAALNMLISNTTLPPVFQSFLVNSLATQTKNSVWVREQTVASKLRNGHLPGATASGRFRTYEGLPGCDLDPIHVSDYHMQPYLTFFPAVAKNTIFTGWSQTQLCPGGVEGGSPADWGKCDAATVANKSEGKIQEWLGNWGWPDGRLVGPMDAVGGSPRKMADGATIFALSTLAAFQNTGDMAFLEATFPHVAAACRWQIAQVSVNGTLPSFWNTYDYMSLEGFDNVAYNAIAHLAGMRACAKIAGIAKDTSGLAEDANSSLALVQLGLNSTLWNGKCWSAAGGVCRDASGRACPSWPWGNQVVMSGSLHGQSWASALGLGALMPEKQLSSHVMEEHRKACAYDPLRCSVGQQMMQGVAPDYGQPGGTTGLLNQSRWVNDVDPGAYRPLLSLKTHRLTFGSG